MKSAKTRPRRGRVDTAELSAEMNDMNDMSGDMLGDMDPDMFGGRGGASLFRQMWEDDVEGEDTPPEPAGPLFDEGQGTCLIESGSGTSADSSEEGSSESEGASAVAEAESATQGVEADQESEDYDFEAEEAEDAENAATAEEEEAVAADNALAEPDGEAANATESAQALDQSGSDSSAPVGSESETTATNASSHEREGTVVVSFGDPNDGLARDADESSYSQGQDEENHRGSSSAAGDASEGEASRSRRDPAALLPPDKAVNFGPSAVLELGDKAASAKVDVPEVAIEPDGTLAMNWGMGSLLDNTEGFIFHEASLEVVEQSQAAAEPEVEDVKIPAELEGVLGRLMEGDSSCAAWGKLGVLLGRFGLGILSNCVRHQVKVCLVPHGEMKSYPAIRNIEGSRRGKQGFGAYIPEKRTCLVAEEALAAPPHGFHPALYFFAQAWDHVLGGDDFASLHSPAVKASFEACRTGMDGHMFADAMAGQSPVHYFAQAAEAYLGENDCIDPLWTREDLYDFDRSMYCYVEYLFQQGNRQQ